MATWCSLTCWGCLWWPIQLGSAPSSTTWWLLPPFCTSPRKPRSQATAVGHHFLLSSPVYVTSCRSFVWPFQVFCPWKTSHLPLRWPLRARPGLRHRRGGPELAGHAALSADRGSAGHSAGTVHVLVQPLLHLHLPVRRGGYREDNPHPHAGQEPVLRSK